MHAMLAVAAPHKTILDDTKRKFESFCLNKAPFRGQNKSFEVRDVALLSFSAPNPIFRDQAFFSTENCALAFCGAPLFDIGQGYGACEINDQLSDRGAVGFRSFAGGSYSILRITESKILAFTDLCGKYPLFYRRLVCGIAVSNNPELLSYVGSGSVSDTWNLSGQAARSLVCHSQIWGDSTLFPGVHLLEPRFGISASPESDCFFDIAPDTWRDFNGVAPLGPRQWQEAGSALNESFQAIKHLCNGKTITLGLSGGKDSRLMAAYAVRNGVNVKLFTSGVEGSPEFDVAQSVASALGTETEIRPSNPDKRPAGENLFDFRYHVGRYHGMLLPVAGFKAPHEAAPHIEVTGFGGELYRGGISKQFVSKPLKDWKDAANRWRNYHVPQDALGIVRPETIATDSAWMADWVESMRNMGFPLHGLPELFFSQYRVPLHQGLAFANSGAKLTIDPLIHPRIQKVHNTIGTFAGSTEMTHASLLWLVDPKLLEINFMKDRWSEKLIPKFNGFNLASNPIAVGTSDATIRPMPWRFFQDNLNAVLDLSNSVESRDLFEFVDKARWLHWLNADGAVKSTPQANQAFTILGLLLRLTGQEIRPIDCTSV